MKILTQVLILRSRGHLEARGSKERPFSSFFKSLWNFSCWKMADLNFPQNMCNKTFIKQKLCACHNSGGYTNFQKLKFCFRGFNFSNFQIVISGQLIYEFYQSRNISQPYPWSLVYINQVDQIGFEPEQSVHIEKRELQK